MVRSSKSVPRRTRGSASARRARLISYINAAAAASAAVAAAISAAAALIDAIRH